MVISNVSNLPPKPGVYIFRDQQGKALYVGKAINLKDRVKSYFQKGLELGPKTALMVSKIEKIEHIIVESEIEALLLEIDLIKRLKPKYNIQWRDDKMYKYISISKLTHPSLASFGRASSNLKTARPWDYAKVSTTRKSEGKDIYFGPFPEGKTVREVLRTLRKVFPFRDCSEAKFRRYQKLGRPCLYGDLKLCPSPCIGQTSPKTYQKNIKSLTLFLFGRRKSLVKNLERGMKTASEKKNFEEAARLRDQIKSLQYVTQSFRPAKEYLLHPDLLEDQRQKELEELRKEVKIERSERIEAYDVSNISGRYATGSMVVFINGDPSKKDYRRFKIKTVRKADDVGMIKEVLRRRFKKSWSFPDLILIDGGKPQVGAVNEVLKEYGLNIPVLGLAKKFEEIVKSDFSLIRFPKDSPAWYLLQRLRDEAHRFAVLYHRKLRARSMTER